MILKKKRGLPGLPRKKGVFVISLALTEHCIRDLRNLEVIAMATSSVLLSCVYLRGRCPDFAIQVKIELVADLLSGQGLCSDHWDTVAIFVTLTYMYYGYELQ